MPFWGLSGFFVGELTGKALWKLVENAQRFPRRGGRVLRPRRRQLPQGARPCATRWLPGRGPRVISNWTAAPVGNYVHVETADLYRPNARFTTETQGYQVLTPFGKLGYSPLYTKETPSAQNSPRRTIVRLQELSPKTSADVQTVKRPQFSWTLDSPLIRVQENWGRFSSALGACATRCW